MNKLEKFAHYMKKWQIFCPLVVYAIIASVAVCQQAATNAHAAVTQRHDGHSAGIVTPLPAVRTNDISSVENTAFFKSATSQKIAG